MPDPGPPLNRPPFFRPLWRRIAVTAIPFGWLVFELLAGSPLWALAFAGLGGYAVWQFFLTWQGPPPD